ncbi:MAG TPA: AbrB/MazE/SpoVT family DNA-binding domain-containing protein [Terracidiphilus sp.]|nr:AbrB/MazE/SpoVT family DNA-binding domain-containing protein [Terracidiphilus sp.]
MSTLTVTAKGQITLKKELLSHLNVSPGEKVEVDRLPGGRVVIRAARPTGSIDAFSGSLADPNGPTLTIEQIKEITEEGWAGIR